MKLILAVAAAALLGGCGGTSTTAPTEAPPRTVTETVVASAPTTPVETTTEELSTALYDYAKGYPKKVPISAVPENMVDYSGAADGLKVAVAIAPGVWVRREAGTTIQENADYGSPFGWCASVKKLEREQPRESGSTCW